MRKYKQSDTTKVIYFYMVDDTTHVTEETGLTVAVTISKNGASFGAATGTVAEIGNGTYKLTPSADDVGTQGPIIFRGTSAGADPSVIEGIIVAYDPYDAVRLGLTALPDANADAVGGLPISDTGGLDLDAILVDTNSIKDQTDSLQFDSANNLATVPVGGVIDTCTTNSDMRGTENAATSAKQDTMETTLNDVPNTSEFEARTLATADYVVVGDTIAGVTTVGTVSGSVNSVTTAVTTDSASRTASQANVSDIPTNLEFNARTIPSDDYVITSDTIAGVTTTTNLTNNNDKTGYALSAAGVDSILDEAVDNDGTAISLRQAQKLLLSILTAKSSGGGTNTIDFRDINDSKTRLSVTVDANGNRTAIITRDAS